MLKDFHVSLDLSTELEPSKEDNFFSLACFRFILQSHAVISVINREAVVYIYIEYIEYILRVFFIYLTSFPQADQVAVKMFHLVLALSRRFSLLSIPDSTEAERQEGFVFSLHRAETRLDKSLSNSIYL